MGGQGILWRRQHATGTEPGHRGPHHWLDIPLHAPGGAPSHGMILGLISFHTRLLAGSRVAFHGRPRTVVLLGGAIGRDARYDREFPRVPLSLFPSDARHATPPNRPDRVRAGSRDMAVSNRDQPLRDDRRRHSDGTAGMGPAGTDCALGKCRRLPRILFDLFRPPGAAPLRRTLGGRRRPRRRD